MSYERLVILAADVKKGDRLFDAKSRDYYEVLTDAHECEGGVGFAAWHDSTYESVALPYCDYCMVLRSSAAH